ncbi:NAD(P)-dependent glycerol-3-phosphate dehydrogenase [Candidatus Peregrinibacteria bacterium]|nr:MAG: NAD(P)-dependent glycerol-3-phosphate dehydrogenase [Candidatus Peregrinibacteria bacterium]
MTETPKIVAVVGAGNMGTTLANLLAKNGHTVRIWDINTDVLQEIQEKQTNTRYLPGVSLSPRITPSLNLSECVAGADYILLVVPSVFLRETVKRFAHVLKTGQILVNCAKGIEESSLKFMIEVIEEEIPEELHHFVADLSGPSLAKEVAEEKMTRVILVSRNQCILPKIKKLLEDGNDYFRAGLLMDHIGVQLGGMMKNIYALAIGICDAVDASYNTKAFVLDAGLSEMTKLGVAMGAHRETFYGLSGVGDLIATCFSENSRNRALGKLLGSGKSLDQALKEMVMVAEGIPATRVTKKLSQKYNVFLPVAEEMHHVLFDGYSAEQSSRALIRIVT